MKFSIIHPYFENKHTLPHHVKEWAKIPPDQAEVIIVDDHSDPSAAPDTKMFKELQLRVRVFRVSSNILWNVSGARNLGAHFSKNPQLILADFDYVVSEKLISHLQTLDYSDPKTVYWPLQRKVATKTKKDGRVMTTAKYIKPHCNSFVINRETFWSMGGYDEDFAGGWGFEDSHFHYVLGPRHGINNVTLDKNGYFIWMEAKEHHPGTLSVGRVNDDRNARLHWYKLTHPEYYRSKYILRFKRKLVYDNGLP